MNVTQEVSILFWTYILCWTNLSLAVISARPCNINLNTLKLIEYVTKTFLLFGLCKNNGLHFHLVERSSTVLVPNAIIEYYEYPSDSTIDWQKCFFGQRRFLLVHVQIFEMEYQVRVLQDEWKCISLVRFCSIIRDFISICISTCFSIVALIQKTDTLNSLLHQDLNDSWRRSFKSAGTSMNNDDHTILLCTRTSTWY